MKVVQINKIKVKIFEDGEVVQKLGLTQEENDIIIKYQKDFPELLQDDLEGFIISTKLLHRNLEVGRDYSTWIKQRINKYNYQENLDYIIKNSIHLNGGIKKSKGGDKKSKDYYVTLDMAKNLALVENNKNGAMARRYFIIMEKALRKYEDWTIIRGNEKDGWNIMKDQINLWCNRNGYDSTLDIFRIREANMLNKNLTGYKASELRIVMGAKDEITRDYLTIEINKALNHLQELNCSLLMSDLDFQFRSNIIKQTCGVKYPNLFLNK